MRVFEVLRKARDEYLAEAVVSFVYPEVSLAHQEGQRSLRLFVGNACLFEQLRFLCA